MEISIVLPCYNEKQAVLNNTIATLQKALLGNTYEIIVVNDGSKQSYSVPEGIKLINHPVNRGYGSALKSGIEVAKHEWIGISDSDGTYPNEEFPKLIAKAKHYDMVVGLRDTKNISLLNRFPKFFLRLLARYITNKKVPDLNSGMRIFRKTLCKEFWNIYPEGFSFTSTITVGALSKKYAVLFLPIPYHKREGKSHIHPIKDTLRFFSLLTRMALYFKPLKVFLPLAVLLLAISIARGLRDYLLQGSLGGLSLLLFFMAFQTFFFGLIAEILSKKQ